MNLQFNRLKKTEHRLKGPAGIIVPTGVLAAAVLVSLMSWISVKTVRSGLERARQELARLEPQAAALRSAQAAADSNRAALAQFKIWSGENRPPMHRVLRAVQKNIPSQMMLYHLSADVERPGENGASYYCALRVSGTAVGELTAVEARRQLNENPVLGRFCGEIKLVSSRRHSAESWAFALEGARPAGGDR